MKPYKNFFFGDGLIFGNPESSVAICTLWTEKEKSVEGIDGSLYNVCGNLYSVDGIGYVIRNIFLNPVIRTIVIYGQDMGTGGEALKKIFAGEPVDIDIPGEYIEMFRKNAELIDMHGAGRKELVKKLAELNKIKQEPFTKPVLIPVVEKKADFIPSESAGYMVRGRTIAQAWLLLVDLVMKFGAVKETEYPQKQKEILNTLAVIDEDDTSIYDCYDFTDEQLKKYLPTILSAEKPATVSYTYGERLFRHEDELKSNQMQMAIEHLKKAPHTRRAVAFTWRVGDAKEEHPPCFTQVSWNIQNNILYQTVVFRSHDIFGAWPMNLLALKELQKKVADEVGAAAGPITCLSVSAHIYENKWAEAEKILKKFYRKYCYDFILDKRGSFTIRLENGKIFVQHYKPDGTRTHHAFEGTDSEEMVKEIVTANLISRLDHAAYMGAELRKAEFYLKSGKKYVQDDRVEFQ
jgi:thymidylate synthase